MDFPITLLQTISAFLIFVFGFLVLMFSVVVSFTIAICVYKGGCLARAYKVRSASLDRDVNSQAANGTDSASGPGAVLRNCMNSFRQLRCWIMREDGVHHRSSVHR
jgi:hypothetical protein